MVKIQRTKRKNATNSAQNASDMFSENPLTSIVDNEREDDTLRALADSIRSHEYAIIKGNATLESIETLEELEGGGDVAPVSSGSVSTPPPPIISNSSRRRQKGIGGGRAEVNNSSSHSSRSASDRSNEGEPITATLHTNSLGSIHGSSRRSMNSNQASISAQSFPFPLPMFPHETQKANLMRLAVALLCFVTSLTISITVGQGQLGFASASYMYKTAVLVDNGESDIEIKGNSDFVDGSNDSQEYGGEPRSNDDQSNLLDLPESDWYQPIISPTKAIPDFASMSITIPEIMEQNLANWEVPFPENTRTETPVFWQIPKAGGSLVQTIFSQCLGLAEASSAGADSVAESKLKIIEDEYGSRFVNVDTSTVGGIQRAKELGLASSGIADVIFTPLLYDIAGLFTQSNHGRLFTILRHPVDRAAALFSHEKKVNQGLADMTIVDYVKAGYVDDNFLTRALLNKPGDVPLTDDDLLVALEILRKKIIVGLTEKMDQTLGKFEKYFGWNKMMDASPDMYGCQNRFDVPSISRPPEVERGSIGWYWILSKNRYDMQVYEYALHLFQVQS